MRRTTRRALALLLAVAPIGAVPAHAQVGGDGLGPDLYSSGALLAKDGDYVGGGSVPVTVGAEDPDGVRAVSLMVDNGPLVATSVNTCRPICSTAYEGNLFLNVGELPQGVVSLHTSGLDQLFTRAEGDGVTLLVDHTPPTVASGITVTDYDADANTATIRWSGGRDGRIAEGVGGSGDGPARVRYRVNDGDWAPWRRIDDRELRVGDVGANARIAVSVQTSDAVGNAAEGTLTTVRAGDDEPSERLEQMAALTGRRDTSATNCQPLVDRVVERRVPPIYAAFLPVRTIVYVNLQIYCRGINDRFERVKIRAGVAIKTGKGNDASDFTKVSELENIDAFNRPKKLPKVIYRNGPTYLCEPEYGGDNDYVAYGNITYVDDDGNDETRDFDTGRGGDVLGLGGKPKEGTCPDRGVRRARELAGWRALVPYLAGQGPEDEKARKRAPSTSLRNALPDEPYKPSGTVNAWQAHHIVPSYQPQADDLRQLLFRCRVHPNASGNGVFLRGYGLRKGTQAYRDLKAHDEALAKRAYHGNTLGANYPRRLRSDTYLGGALAAAPERCSDGVRGQVTAGLKKAEDALITSDFGVERDD